ncbi:MAG: tRNA (adenosine(37)-N6)-dimethylallyltransferase MiaA [Saccharofermentans sp.]|nr:tRNA (adenosine(37)-N6)-dimethylallyltransferase MiaA [Saccharofermentans sp.]
MMSTDKMIPIITGPTASGKSALALKLCEITGGELISCDSMQIYRKLDVGTAKPTIEDQALVRHHMIDIIDPGDNYNVSMFIEGCYKAIEDILSRGKLPVLCGGTGQYISALKDGITFEEDPLADEMTEKLYEEYRKNGIDSIYQRLVDVDPESAAKIHPNNTRRVIRALAVYEATGKTKTERNIDSVKEGPRYNFKLFQISYEDDRSILYDRTNRRVDIMMEQGLEKEARYLYSLPIDRKSTCCQAIGYKEFLPLIDEQPGSTLERVAYEIKLNTRHFAKRQLTWFRYIDCIQDINRDLSIEEQAKIVLDSISCSKNAQL